MKINAVVGPFPFTTEDGRELKRVTLILSNDVRLDTLENIIESETGRSLTNFKLTLTSFEVSVPKDTVIETHYINSEGKSIELKRKRYEQKTRPSFTLVESGQMSLLVASIIAQNMMKTFGMSLPTVSKSEAPKEKQEDLKETVIFNDESEIN